MIDFIYYKEIYDFEENLMHAIDENIYPITKGGSSRYNIKPIEVDKWGVNY